MKKRNKEKIKRIKGGGYTKSEKRTHERRDP